MRMRTLKPGFFKNEHLAELGAEAMLLFEGLWCLADSEGRLEDRPRRIRAEVFPYWNIDVEQLLVGLAECGFILRYRAAGCAYIAIRTWKRHQRVRTTEAASEIPPPPDAVSGPTPTVESSQISMAFPEGDILAPKGDTLPLGSRSQIPDPNSQDLGSRIPDPEPEAAAAPPPVAGTDAEFDAFYMAYPRHEGKAEARKAFKNLRPPAELQRALLADCIERYRGIECDKIPYPATYLNQRRWEDEDMPSKLALRRNGAPPGPVLSPGMRNIYEHWKENVANGRGRSQRSVVAREGDLVPAIQRRRGREGLARFSASCGLGGGP